MSKTAMTRGAQRRQPDNTLSEAKMALIRAHERGDNDALTQALRAHPAYADALTAFDLGLRAAEGYADDLDAPDVLEIAQAARAQAFAAVFGAPTSAAAAILPTQATPAALSLRALRQARGHTSAALAGMLGLGIDVLSALEGGRIRVASMPRQLYTALSEALDVTAGQISAALTLNTAPALRRGQRGASSTASGQLDFADAIMVSQSMTPEQRARWLAESAEM